MNNNYDFTLVIYDNLEGAGNIFSPTLLYTTLSLIKKAANNKTLEEFKKLIKIDNLFDTKKIIMIIDKCQEIEKEYLKMIDNFVDIFVINHNKSLQNQIQIINKFNIDVQFKYKFDVNKTFESCFHYSDDDRVLIMNQTNFFNYYETDKIQAVELPLSDSDFVMGIILEKNYKENYSINNVLELKIPELHEIINNMEYTFIDLYIPKFTHRKIIHFKPILFKLGLISIFQPIANLDTIFESAYISNIIQEITFQISENGDITENYYIHNFKTFRADHIFLYYIRYVPDNIFILFGDYQGN